MGPYEILANHKATDIHGFKPKFLNRLQIICMSQSHRYLFWWLRRVFHGFKDFQHHSNDFQI